MIAEDFFEDPENWVENRPKKSSLLGQVHRRVAKEIVHLTYIRQKVAPEEKRWQLVEIGNQVQYVIDRFLALITKDKLGKRWNDYKGL